MRAQRGLSMSSPPGGRRSRGAISCSRACVPPATCSTGPTKDSWAQPEAPCYVQAFATLPTNLAAGQSSGIVARTSHAWVPPVSTSLALPLQDSFPRWH